MADAEQGKAVTRAAMNITAGSATLLSMTRPPISFHLFHLLSIEQGSTSSVLPLAWRLLRHCTDHLKRSCASPSVV